MKEIFDVTLLAVLQGVARDVQVKEALCEGPTVRSFDLTVSAGEALSLFPLKIM